MACQSGKLLVEVPRDIYLSYGHSLQLITVN